MDLHSTFETPAPAVVLAEGEFGEPGGKTANGVVLHGDRFDARVVVDSTHAGETAATVLDHPDANDVPVVGSMTEALERAPHAEALVIGVAPAGGDLPDAWIADIREAMAAGCDVVSGLHVFLTDSPEWREYADECGVYIFDVRKPPGEDDLRVADGRVKDRDADVVLVAGTDCAVGKRSTTYELYRAARAAGLDAGWVATGQTGIMTGADRGVVVDRVPADFTAGVVEDMVADVATDRDLVFVEGQAALSHRAYSGVTLAILHGCWPDAVVVAHDPDRTHRAHFEQFSMTSPGREIDLVESLADASVAAVSTWGDADETEAELGLPAANVFDEGGPGRLLRAVREAL